jgi:hypothetical protein
VTLKHFRSRGLRVSLSATAQVNEPISAEIFSVERLELYAATLARTQEISAGNSSGVSLHSRLRDNAATLNSAYQTLLQGIRNAHAVTPAAQWLVDNYYVVDTFAPFAATFRLNSTNSCRSS